MEGKAHHHAATVHAIGTTERRAAHPADGTTERADGIRLTLRLYGIIETPNPAPGFQLANARRFAPGREQLSPLTSSAISP